MDLVARPEGVSHLPFVVCEHMVFPSNDLHHAQCSVGTTAGIAVPEGRNEMSTEQHTKCAVCGKDKHTPLRRDEMGGYVCLTCIEAKIDKLEERNAQLEKELDAGDSWAWIRAKFEKSKDKFRWYKPRADGLIGTRYEVMGWLHCLFADADPTVFIDITLEHQKRTDEAEAENKRLRELLSASEDYRKAYADGKYKLYAMGGEICEAAAKHLPMSEGPLERASRKALKS